MIIACFEVDLVQLDIMRDKIVEQKLRLIELMQENAWIVDKSDPKYKNHDKKGEKWEKNCCNTGEEGKLSDLSRL